MTSHLLIEALSGLERKIKIAFIADENININQCVALCSYSELCFLTNRYDLFQEAELLLKGIKQAVFSDFDLQALPDQEYDVIAYRISKERPVTHRLINQVQACLRPGGAFLLSGRKEEGIKNYVDKCTKQLGYQGKLVKQGSDYFAHLIWPASKAPSASPLDDKNYTHLRHIGNAFDFSVFSKPGQYGWQKFDEGSQLLAAELSSWLASNPIESALDLGCGYGYLSLALAAAGIKNITATDNNAAALISCQVNLKQTTSNAMVAPSDCAESLNGPFDLVVCNPPFHQGFDVEATLTKKFVNAAYRMLSNGGTALFVVNSFIGLEKIAASLFHKYSVLINNRKFKVLALTKLN